MGKFQHPSPDPRLLTLWPEVLPRAAVYSELPTGSWGGWGAGDEGAVAAATGGQGGSRPGLGLVRLRSHWVTVL